MNLIKSNGKETQKKKKKKKRKENNDLSCESDVKCNFHPCHFLDFHLTKIVPYTLKLTAI